MSRSLKILVVDDEQVVLDSIRKHLHGGEYMVRGELTVARVMEILDTEKFDIVLTDLMMPEVDGLELLSRVKRNWPHTPVIMITGYATIDTALRAMQLGAFDYIAKPFTKAELLTVVERAAELVRASAQTDDCDGNEDSERLSQHSNAFKELAAHGWTRLQDDGRVLMGVEHSFLDSIGKVQNLFLPAQGDELRQGSAYLRVFSADLRSHTVLSPLSGVVVEVNEKALADPQIVNKGESRTTWLIRLQPSKLELEMKDLDL